AEHLRLGIDIAPDCAALHPGAPRMRIHAYRSHRREVEHNAALADRVAGHVVATAANGDCPVALAGESDCFDHIAGVTAADDQRRAPIDHGVPYRAGTVVDGIAGLDRRAQ